MAKNDTHWKLEPHTQAKHALLTGYLKMWFPVLSKWSGRIVVIDGFAGPGTYESGEPGSPLLVLRTLLDHNYLGSMTRTSILLVFNEMQPERFEALDARVEEERASRDGWPKNVRVEVTQGNFQDLAEGILDGLEGKNLAPTFAFLDPFGYSDVPIDLIKRLLSYERCELFLYFDYNSVSRFATAGNVDGHFTALYGTDEYQQAPASGPERKEFLIRLYERQLRQVCGFNHVRSFEMVNAQNRTGNYMIFCTRSLKGLEGMKSAMWKVAPMGDYRFADRLAGQEVLLGLDDVDTGPLRDDLLKTFAGQTVTIEAVTSHTIANTGYLSTHVKMRTLKPMQAAGMITSPNQKRNGQFPDGTQITFP